MSNSLRIGKKVLSLALAFIVAVGFMLVMNTDKAFADDPILLDSLSVNVEVPEIGTTIESPTQYTQEPELVPTSADSDPHYHFYSCYWSTETGNPFEGTVESGVPLYGILNICSDYEDYYWNHDDEWKFSGTVTVNGGDATVISAVIPEYGGNHYEEYLEVLVKFIPKEKERTALNSVEVTADVPKAGTEIKKIDSWTQAPDPNVQIAATDPQYGPYGSYWSKDSDNWSWSNYYEGVVDGETPLYLAMSFYIRDTDNYYWANEPDADAGDEAGGSYTGTVTVNGKKAEVIYAKTWENGKYVNLIVKLMPETDPTPTPTPTPTPAPVATAPVMAKMVSSGNTALKFTWSTISGAEGYDIYLSRCNYGDNKFTPELVKTVNGNKTKKWTKKGLEKRTPYKGYVKAFKLVNGQKEYIGESLVLHEYTSGGNKKYTNAKSVTVKKDSVSLKNGGTYKVKASVKKLKSGKKLINETHTAKLRYISSNEAVATVDASGQISAKGNGKCKVYAIAANGARKAIKITVK